MEFHLALEPYLETYRYKQTALYAAFRDAIQGGRFPYGTQLPSSRELGRRYGLSRGVVYQVYERLMAEGFLEAVLGSGTYVRYRQSLEPGNRLHTADLPLSDWGRRLEALASERELRPRATPNSRRFADVHPSGPVPEPSGVGVQSNGTPLPERQLVNTQATSAASARLSPTRLPAVDQPSAEREIRFDFGHAAAQPFPAPEWRRLLYAEVRANTEAPAAAAPAQGYRPLREAIARHLRRARGLDVTADTVVVVSGSMQALALLAQLLLNAGDKAVLENPGYTGIRSAVFAAGGVPVPGRVDGQGLVVEPWDARLVFVTPSRQFPTGAVMSLPRRQALLQWAAENGAVVIEDDFDSEFRHRGRPIEPLKGLDRDGRVVFVGTFTRTMQAQLRIGYAVLPERLVEPFVRALQLYEPSPAAALEQRALAQFMAGGGYERHMRRMGRLYSRRFDRFGRLFERVLGRLFEIVPSDAGLHIFARWRSDEAGYLRFRAHCAGAGVVWVDAQENYIGVAEPAACFFFAHLNEAELEEGVERMERVASALGFGGLQAPEE
ncbi:aminotransferase-like domain-containing protein [Paenibacillus koleovorans]|uniref:aminotransferase-like domain-containing protein n=1 Tax=Paenibacillus koleovorans TaxID=121608 RepID=UPI000FDCB681|nr:PLP-dependent aminotransferase family protein [Paenibacillus koleovorans]